MVISYIPSIFQRPFFGGFYTPTLAVYDILWLCIICIIVLIIIITSITIMSTSWSSHHHDWDCHHRYYVLLFLFELCYYAHAWNLWIFGFTLTFTSAALGFPECQVKLMSFGSPERRVGAARTTKRVAATMIVTWLWLWIKTTKLLPVLDVLPCKYGTKPEVRDVLGGFTWPIHHPSSNWTLVYSKTMGTFNLLVLNVGNEGIIHNH